jgi:hypothetical protein
MRQKTPPKDLGLAFGNHPMTENVIYTVFNEDKITPNPDNVDQFIKGSPSGSPTLTRKISSHSRSISEGGGSRGDNNEEEYKENNGNKEVVDNKRSGLNYRDMVRVALRSSCAFLKRDSDADAQSFKGKLSKEIAKKKSGVRKYTL